MIVLGIILTLIGSLVPNLDGRAKSAMVVTGIILIVVGCILLIAPGGYNGSYNWPFYRPLP